MAEAYDAWIPVDELLPEESRYRELSSVVEGTVLEGATTAVAETWKTTRGTDARGAG